MSDIKLAMLISKFVLCTVPGLKLGTSQNYTDSGIFLPMIPYYFLISRSRTTKCQLPEVNIFFLELGWSWEIGSVNQTFKWTFSPFPVILYLSVILWKFHQINVLSLFFNINTWFSVTMCLLSHFYGNMSKRNTQCQLQRKTNKKISDGVFP